MFTTGSIEDIPGIQEDTKTAYRIHTESSIKQY
jgi:hypothetical protein